MKDEKGAGRSGEWSEWEQTSVKGGTMARRSCSTPRLAMCPRISYPTKGRGNCQIFARGCRCRRMLVKTADQSLPTAGAMGVVTCATPDGLVCWRAGLVRVAECCST